MKFYFNKMFASDKYDGYFKFSILPAIEIYRHQKKIEQLTIQFLIWEFEWVYFKYDKEG